MRLLCKFRPSRRNISLGGAADRYTYTKSPSLEEQEVQPQPQPRQTFSLLPLRSNVSFLKSRASRKSSSKENKKKEANHLQHDKCQESNIDEGEIANLHSVPTAIGYQSSLSEDEWLDEQSRASRYATWDDEELKVLASGQQQDEEAGEVDRYTTLVVMDSSIETSSSSPSLQDSFESVEEQKIGNQLQRERERLKATIVENNTAGPKAAGITFDLCFGPNATKAMQAVVASECD